MALQDQFEMGRIPIKLLPYENKALANKGELMIDNTGASPSFHLYITDSNDESNIIDITSRMIKEAFGNSITVNIVGVENPVSINDAINFIYKRFLYPNSSNFNYENDKTIITDSETKTVLLKDNNGNHYFPVTSTDSIFDRYGNSIEDRLNSISRIGFANDYIKAEVNDQSIFEITYPFINYPNGGNYLELRAGTVFIDKSRYQIINSYDEDGNIYGATITFFNDRFEQGRRIDILYIYNAAVASSTYSGVSGNQIADGSIASSKLEKVTDSYSTPDSSAIATGRALYDLYTELSNMYASGSNARFVVDEISGNSSTIRVNICDTKLSNNYIMLTILVNEMKSNSITLDIIHDLSEAPTSTTFSIQLQNEVPAGKLLKVLVNKSNVKVLDITGARLKSTRYIYTCQDQDTVINFNNLTYTNESLIKVYRNGVRLFVDLDYSLNSANETITLFVRAEDGEKIIFEAETIEY